MNKTYFIFSRPKKSNLLSLAIRKFTKSNVSHVALAYWDLDYQAPMIMEAAWNGFRHVALYRWLKTNHIVAWALPADVESGVRSVAIEYLGSNYPWYKLVGMALRQVFKLKNPFRGRSEVFCSEAAAMILVRSGRLEWQHLSPRDISPADLVKEMDRAKVIRYTNSEPLPF